MDSDHEGGSSAILNICRLMEKSGVAYSMSLLALCGFHGRKEMAVMLLTQGAGNAVILLFYRYCIFGEVIEAYYVCT